MEQKNIQEKLEATFAYSEDFQIQLLAELCRNRDFSIIAVHHLKPNYFTYDIYVDIFRVIQDFVTTFNAVPVSANLLLDHYTDIKGENKKLELTDIHTNLLRAFYAKDNGEYTFKYDPNVILHKINDFMKRQAMKIALVEALGKVKEGSYDEIRTLIVKALSVGVSDIGTYTLDHGADIIDKFKADRESFIRVPTPVYDLNIKINGGIGKQELFVFLAPPNRGKTLAMGSFAAHALLNKYKVIYYTLEMTENKIGTRLIQALCHVTQEQLLNASSIVKEKIQKLSNYVSQDFNELQEVTLDKKDIIIKHYTSKSCNIHTLTAHMAMLEAGGFKPDIIFIDYADLMSPTQRYMDKRNELSAIYTELRDLAIERNVAVVTASQANRASLSEETVTMAHIAEDFGKVAIADVIVSISQTPAEKGEKRVRFLLIKNRDGEASDHAIKVPVSYEHMTLGTLIPEKGVAEALVAQQIIGKNQH